MLLRSANIEVVDLGVDVPADEVVRAAREVEPDVIGLSGTAADLVPHHALDDRGAAGGPGRRAGAPRIIVGGGQMTAETAAWIGADRWSDNAGAAVPEIVEMVAAARAAADGVLAACRRRCRALTAVPRAGIHRLSPETGTFPLQANDGTGSRQCAA